MYDALLNLPAWGIVLTVVIPACAILIPSAWFTLGRNRCDRGNDSVYTAAARLGGVSIAILGAFCVLIVWQADADWRARTSLEFANANAMLDRVSAVDPNEAKALTASLHAYTIDVLTNELHRQPNTSEDSVANREMKSMATVIDGYADRQLAPNAESTALLTDFQEFSNQRAERLTAPVDVLDPYLALTLVVVAVMTLLLVGFYPAGPSTFAKWLQVGTSGLVIVAIVATPLVLESVPLNQGPHEKPILAFLDRLDQSQH
ncbi:hypothetical protein BH09ACT8_BH09ACT8_58920 [soil metagenome]